QERRRGVGARDDERGSARAARGAFGDAPRCARGGADAGPEGGPGDSDTLDRRGSAQRGEGSRARDGRRDRVRGGASSLAKRRSGDERTGGGAGVGFVPRDGDIDSRFTGIDASAGAARARGSGAVFLGAASNSVEAAPASEGDRGHRGA